MSKNEPQCEKCPECDNLLRYHKNQEGKAEQICYCGHYQPCTEQHSADLEVKNFPSCDKPRFHEHLEQMHLTKLEPPQIKRILAHPSYHQLEPEAEDFRPLDFLGDAVLDLIVREQQLLKNPKKAVMKRNVLVSNAYLAQIFDQLELQPAVRKPRNNSILKIP